MQTQQKKNMLGKGFISQLGKYGIYIILLLLIVIMSFASDAFMTPTNWKNLLRQVSINGCMAMGMIFVISVGAVDLSAGSIVALAGVIACTFAHPGEYPLITVILISILVGSLVGLINGLLVSFTGIAPFIITLGMDQVARGSAMLYTDGRPMRNFDKVFNVIGQGFFGGIPIPVIIFAVLIVIVYFVLHRTKFGRYVLATGGNMAAANASGINVKRIKTMAYVLMGLFAGISAVILSSRTNTANPNAADGYQLDAIAACAIGGASLSGGRSSVIGAVVGVLIIGIINNGLDLLNVSSYLQSVVKGVLIVLSVLLDKISIQRAAAAAAKQAALDR